MREESTKMLQLNTHSNSRPKRIGPAGLGGIAIAITAAVGVSAWFLIPLGKRLFATAAADVKPAEPPAAEKSETPPPNTIKLSEAKIQLIGVKFAEAREISLPAVITVPGKVEADPASRIDVRPRAPGVVKDVKVIPGSVVARGDRLVSLESAEVATARLVVQAKLRELAVKRFEADWKREVAANVEAIIPMLRADVPAATIEKRFEGKSLGSDRALLIAAYSELEIAVHEEIKQADLFKKEIVGEHPMLVSKHTRESAQAKFEAALEQVRQDAQLEKRTADQQLELAKSNVIDAYEKLRLLGVDDPLPDLDSIVELKSIASKVSESDALASCVINAPFAGTIVTRSPMAVYSQKVDPVDTLLTLADLNRVWIVASIPESSFALLPDLRGSTLNVTAAAYPGRTFASKVLFTSAEVDPSTRAARLAAEADNHDMALRLGMFVQVHIDTTSIEKGLAVPAGSVVEIDGKSGVFVAGTEPRSFVFHPVEVGREAGGLQIVKKGIETGAKVVAHGAFMLKSELILQNEPDDE
jgi:RND family efflux transporter MFP subunit